MRLSPRRLLRTTVTAALVGAALVVPAHFALAGTPLPAVIGKPATADKPVTTASPKWITAPCAQGGFTGTEAYPRPYVVLHGYARACAEPPAGAKFAIVGFSADSNQGSWDVDMMRPYNSTAPRPFGVMVSTLRTNLFCLMSSPTARHACVEISFNADGTDVRMTPVATDDPRVDKPVKFSTMPPPPKPTCGTCF